jgi:hypothetical protein
LVHSSFVSNRYRGFFLQGKSGQTWSWPPTSI